MTDAARALIAMFLWVTPPNTATMTDVTSVWHASLRSAWDAATEEAWRSLESSEHTRAVGEALRSAASDLEQAVLSDRAEAHRVGNENVSLRLEVRDLHEQLECARAIACYLDEQNTQLKEANRLLATEAMVEVRARLRLMEQRTPAKPTDAVEEDCCCAICTEILVLPVTHRCGHTLCAPCYSRIIHGTGVARACPMCREPLQVTDVAIQLRSLVESRYPREVAQRLDAFIAQRDGANARLRAQSTDASDNLLC